MQEMWVQPLGWEDNPGEGSTTHSNNLAWENPWTQEPGGLKTMGLQKTWTQFRD